MEHNHILTYCISTHNNLPYLKLAIESVRKNSYYKDAPFIIHAENCNDGTDEWLIENKNIYDLQIYIEHNTIPIGIGGGMNF
jgi:GT2 family glycosyltransferase